MESFTKIQYHHIINSNPTINHNITIIWVSKIIQL